MSDMPSSGAHDRGLGFTFIIRLLLLTLMVGTPAKTAVAEPVADSLAPAAPTTIRPASGGSRFLLEGGLGLRFSPGRSAQQGADVPMICIDLRFGGYVRPSMVVDGSLGFAGASMPRPPSLGQELTDNGYIDWNKDSFLSFTTGSLGLRLIRARPSHEFFGRLAVGFENSNYKVKGMRYEYLFFIPIPTGTTSRSSSELLPMLQASAGLALLAHDQAPAGKDRIFGIQRAHRSRVTLEAGYTFRQDAEFNSLQTRAGGRGWFTRIVWGVTLLPDAPS